MDLLKSINSPVPSSMVEECRKCARIIQEFSQDPDKFIPSDIIANAKGVAILTVIKAGFIWSGRAGSGLVVSRHANGSWSAPSAISTAGMGFGGQIGAELTDFIIILNTEESVNAFSQGGNVLLGGNLSVSAGPFGRTAEAGGAVLKPSAVYSYSKSKGLFAGISIEGSFIAERKNANEAFYGKKIGAAELLSGNIAAPPACDALYKALNDNVNRSNK